MTWFVGLPSPGKIVLNGFYLDRMNRERVKVPPQDAQLHFIVFDKGGSYGFVMGQSVEKTSFTFVPAM
jgi:hypothetical protein